MRHHADELPSMESAELVSRFEKARRAIADGETDIRYQRDIILHLKHAGEDAGAARALLKTLLQRQAQRRKNLAFIIRQFPPKAKVALVQRARRNESASADSVTVLKDAPKGDLTSEQP
jgi:hypothetical protein